MKFIISLIYKILGIHKKRYFYITYRTNTSMGWITRCEYKYPNMQKLCESVMNQMDVPIEASEVLITSITELTLTEMELFLADCPDFKNTEEKDNGT